MSSESPAVVLYDSSGNSLATAAGTAPSSVITIQGNASGTPVPVSGTVTATNPSVGTTAAAVPASATFVGGEVQTLQSGLTTGDLYPLSLTTAGALRIDGSATTQPVSGTVTANAGTGSFTVVQATASNLNAAVVGVGTAGSASGGILTVQGVASMTPISVLIDTSTTGTITSVSGATSSTTLLASNTNRKGATIFNDTASGNLLYVGLTASAVSATSYSIKLWPGSYYDLPINYTGQITGIWTSAAGFARVTELT